MKRILSFALGLLLFAALTAPASAVPHYSKSYIHKVCMMYLHMSKAQQNAIAARTGYSAALHIWSCKSLLGMKAGKRPYTPSRGDDDVDHEPLWYGTSCSTTRECGATENCINHMCKPSGYGGCNNTDTCPGNEQCVAGSCQ